MKIFLLTVTIYIEWSNSLKDKRSVVQSLKNKIHNKFNVSVAETENQDLHKKITLSISGITGDIKLSSKTEENIIDFIESNTDGVIENIYSEIIY